jgi:hypothetical protein
LNTRPPPGISTLIFLSSVAGSEEAVERIAGLALEQLKVLAQATVLGGSGWPPRLRTGAAVTEAINELVHALKVIVHDLFETRRSEVRWVSETAQLDQEEALAYLLADLLDYELLPEEAHPIGNAAQAARRAPLRESRRRRSRARRSRSRRPTSCSRTGRRRRRRRRGRRRQRARSCALAWRSG